MFGRKPKPEEPVTLAAARARIAELEAAIPMLAAAAEMLEGPRDAAHSNPVVEFHGETREYGSTEALRRGIARARWPALLEWQRAKVRELEARDALEQAVHALRDAIWKDVLAQQDPDALKLEPSRVAAGIREHLRLSDEAWAVRADAHEAQRQRELARRLCRDALAAQRRLAERHGHMLGPVLASVCSTLDLTKWLALLEAPQPERDRPWRDRAEAMRDEIERDEKYLREITPREEEPEPEPEPDFETTAEAAVISRGRESTPSKVIRDGIEHDPRRSAGTRRL